MGVLLASLRDLIWPATCICSDAHLDHRPRYGLCDVCVDASSINDGRRCPGCDAPGVPCCEPGPLSMRAPFLYGGRVAEAIAAAKFHDREDIARGLGRLLAQHITPVGCTAVVPLPLAAGRRFTRGYNQSVLLAREVASAHQLPLVHGLKRTRATATQHMLPLVERHGNLANAFAARHRFSGRVVLVDDVITTGATMRSAARALFAAGATEVHGLAIARTPKLTSGTVSPPGRVAA